MTWTFFPRGPGPLVSVLIASKGNVPGLLAAMDSIWSLARDRSLIEFLVKVDEDDDATRDALNDLKERVEGVVVRTVVRPSEQESNEAMDVLAAESRGDWLLPFADDAVFKTEGWDQRLLNMVEKDSWAGIADVCLVVTNDPAFCFLRRKTWEILGTISPHPDVAGWLRGVMGFLSCCLEVDVAVERKLGEQIPTKFDRYAKLAAIDVLTRYLEKVWGKVKWQEKPKWHGWYILRDDATWRPVYLGRDSSVYGLRGNDVASLIKMGAVDDVQGTWAVLDDYVGFQTERHEKTTKQQPKVFAGNRPTTASVWTSEKPNKDGWYWHRDNETKDVLPLMLVGKRAMVKAIDGVATMGEKSVDEMNGDFTPVAMLEREGHKRGDGPLVSVILPSRGRAKMLVECVNSFYDNAFDKDAVEMLIKADDDDETTIDAVNQLEALGMARLFRSPRDNGYADLHKWVNWLAAEAKGDWLYVFNDDARMTTPQWDVLLLNEYPHHPAARKDVAILVTPINSRPNSHEFMFVRRNIFQLLGHYSPIPQLDTWMFSVGVMIQCLNYSPIKVEHKNDGMNDQTAEDRRRVSEANLHLVVSPPSIIGRVRDCLTLLGYLENFWWGHER